jgi:hypothetical protein
MRILHVVPIHLPAVRYGELIFAVHGLCRALAARGHELQVFTTNVDGPGIIGREPFRLISIVAFLRFCYVRDHRYLRETRPRSGQQSHARDAEQASARDYQLA